MFVPQCSILFAMNTLSWNHLSHPLAVCKLAAQFCSKRNTYCRFDFIMLCKLCICPFLRNSTRLRFFRGNLLSRCLLKYRHCTATFWLTWCVDIHLQSCCRTAYLAVLSCMSHRLWKGNEISGKHVFRLTKTRIPRHLHLEVRLRLACGPRSQEVQLARYHKGNCITACCIVYHCCLKDFSKFIGSLTSNPFYALIPKWQQSATQSTMWIQRGFWAEKRWNRRAWKGNKK